jgi:dienelactone hydrolase
MKQEPIILGKNTRYPLKGMLTLPDDLSTPVPALVLVHGSGSSNMDEKVGKLTPFKDIALGLAERGVACIRYDKRSFAHGLKMVRDKSTVITAKEEVIEDALLAAELLRADRRIDPKRVFLLGHSMGGMLAPRIECSGGDFAGLILMAGSPRRLEEIMLDQMAEMLAGMPGFTQKIAGKQRDKFAKLFEGLYDLSDEEAKAKKVGGGTTLYYFKELGQPTVAQWLEKTSKPMLVMQGEKDFQAKAAVDFEMYKQLLSHRDNVTFRLYPGLNHAFVPARFDSIADAKKEFTPERHIGAEVLDDIAGWIKVR